MPRQLVPQALLLLAAGCSVLRPVEVAVVDAGEAAPDAGAIPADGGWDAGLPLHAAVGGPCEIDADCAAIPAGARCLTEGEAATQDLSAPGGYCTSATCTASCGLATACADIGTGAPTCAAACGTATDCRPGFRCADGACAPGLVGVPDGGYPERWGAASLPEGLVDDGHSWLASYSADMKRVCFTSFLHLNEQSELYCAERASASSAFGAPVAQTHLNTPSDARSGFLWRDKILFDSNRSGTRALYEATWDPILGQYANVVLIMEDAASPSLTRDGLTLYFESTRSGGSGASDIYSARRAKITDAFGEPHNETILNSSAEDWYPNVAADGSFLTLTSTRAGGNANNTAWIAYRAAGGGWMAPIPAPLVLLPGWTSNDLRPLPDGTMSIGGQVGDFYSMHVLSGVGAPPPPSTTWGTPVPIVGVNTSGANYSASMTPDGRRLCFGSNRSGGSDIWCAFRSGSSDAFGVPISQTALNTAFVEDGPELSPDGSELLFDSNRTGVSRIYRATWNASAGAYDSPLLVGGLGDVSIAPALSSDGLTMFYATQVTGELQVTMAMRPSLDAPFGHVTNVGELNARIGIGDWQMGLSPDYWTMPFVSSRPLPGTSTSTNPPYSWISGWDGRGLWRTPVLATVGGRSPVKAYHPRVLSDGALLFHSPEFGGSNDAIYIAPPLLLH